MKPLVAVFSLFFALSQPLAAGCIEPCQTLKDSAEKVVSKTLEECLNQKMEKRSSEKQPQEDSNLSMQLMGLFPTIFSGIPEPKKIQTKKVDCQILS